MKSKKQESVNEQELEGKNIKDLHEDLPQADENSEEAIESTVVEDDITAKLEEIATELEEQRDKYLRLAAEFDNFRKRTMKEKSDLILNGGEKALNSILPVVDDFERAISTMEKATDVEAVKQGIDLIYNKFMSVLSQNGVKKIATDNQSLDTDYHEAIAEIGRAHV